MVNCPEHRDVTVTSTATSQSLYPGQEIKTIEYAKYAKKMQINMTKICKKICKKICQICKYMFGYVEYVR